MFSGPGQKALGQGFLAKLRIFFQGGTLNVGAPTVFTGTNNAFFSQITIGGQPSSINARVVFYDQVTPFTAFGTFYYNAGFTFFTDSVFGPVWNYGQNGKVTFADSVTSNNNGFTSGGTVAWFVTKDRAAPNTAFGAIYHQSGFTFLYDSVFGNSFKYDTAGNCTAITSISSPKITLSAGPMQDSGYAYTQPTTGQTTQLTNSWHTIIDPAGALLALTVNMPTAPIDGQLVEFKVSTAITTLTLTATGTGQVIKGGPAAGTSAAGAAFSAIYRLSNTTWYF